MTTTSAQALTHIEKSSYALLITVDEENAPSAREIGPFVNNGLDVCFVTRLDSQKIRHINGNPVITLYFPNTNQSPKEFRSVAITGKAARVPEGDEFNGVMEKLDKKSPGYMKYISKEGFTIWTVYKMTAASLQYTDYSKSTRTVKEKL
jgi:nitroimidazol reductase NimA-like FMN-containing flavoprotein (pyridoxamine 5'-phosphate oxidase superfamily)